MSAPGARERLITAALEEIHEHGWAATSLQRVRERAGVSNGSLFHHFPTRTHLEAAVLGRALADHQAAVVGILHRSRSARSAVRAVVATRVEWIVENPGVAMMLLASLPGELRDQVVDETEGERRGYLDEVAAWLRAQGWTGAPELPVLMALWLGPANELARNTLAAGGDPPPPSVVEVLGDGAWHALVLHLGEDDG